MHAHTPIDHLLETFSRFEMLPSTVAESGCLLLRTAGLEELGCFVMWGISHKACWEEYYRFITLSLHTPPQKRDHCWISGDPVSEDLVCELYSSGVLVL